MTKISDLHEAFRNSFLFKGKTARKISGHKAKKLTESLVASDSGPIGKDKKDGAYVAGSRTWGDGEALWYEMVPPVVYRKVDGSTERYEYVLISHVDGKTRAYGSGSDGRIWNPSDSELYSEKGDVSCEKVLQVLGYKIEGDADSVTHTKEEGTKSVESYEEYEDEKDDEESETPEGETGTPEPRETKTPEAEETGSPEPEDDDEDEKDLNEAFAINSAPHSRGPGYGQDQSCSFCGNPADYGHMFNRKDMPLCYKCVESIGDTMRYLDQFLGKKNPVIRDVSSIIIHNLPKNPNMLEKDPDLM